MIGGRFRNDYLSFKYFGQDGWGSEKGKILKDGSTVVLTERAQALIKDAGNLELNGANLEAGAEYVLVIDLSKAAEGIETIDFYKK